MRRKFLEAEENSNMTPEEKKLLQQKLQEEADLEVAKEMLGVDESDEDSIDRMNPKSKEDFIVFEQALQKKIQSFSKSDHYSDFIEELIRNLSVTRKSFKSNILLLLFVNILNNKYKLYCFSVNE